MDTAREERRPYEGGGLGAGGKFRKQPFRRTTHSTPYDRPPTALRNPTGGWLSKLVDPAHRLITSSALRFFSTVFRKRHPSPQPASTEANSEARNKQQEAVAPDIPGEQLGAVDQSDAPRKSSNGGGLNELEQILKQKTFTRSEIDRLTALLHSKTIDTSIEKGEKRDEAIHLKSVASHDPQNGFPKIHAQDNGIETHLNSTPAVGSSVLDEDVASPTELAKAYMGSRPSKVSPSTLGIQSQAFRENSTALSCLPFPSKIPATPLGPRTSGHTEALANGFITPKSRGRSALYSMARTPYSRVHQTTSLKGVGSAVSAFGGPSSSQSAQDQNLFSSSKQGALKRRSSVLDNDIGSIGPMRRIRQKQSLLSSRGLSPPVSGSLSISGAGLGSAAAQKPSSSTQKLSSFGELKNDYRKSLAENEESTKPSTSFCAVPTKSSEMASKILQQLDKLVSPKEKSSGTKLLTLMGKSPAKLSPSMLRGQALKSLEAIDSSKFLGDVQDNKKLECSVDKTIPDARETTSLKQDVVKQNRPLNIVVSCDKSTAAVNGVDSAAPKNASMSIEASVSAAPIFDASPPQKKRAFQMSAHEDFLDLDDDVDSNGAASHSLVNERHKVDTDLAERNSHDAEAVRVEKPPAFLEGKPSTSAENKKHDTQTPDGSLHAEKNSKFVISSASSPNMAVQHTEVATQLTSDVAFPPKVPNAMPIFNFGDKVVSSKDPDAASPIFSFASKAIEKVPETYTKFASSPAVATESAAMGFGTFYPKSETSSSFPTVPASAADSILKVPEPSKVGIDGGSDYGVLSRIPENGVPSAPAPAPAPTTIPTPATSLFSFSKPPNSSIPNNGSSALTSSTPVGFNGLTSQSSTNSTTFSGAVSNVSTPSVSAATNTVATSSSILTSTPASSSPAGSIFKFGSTSSTAVAPVFATPGLLTSESMAKDTCFGISGTPFGVTAAATGSTGSNIFGFGATATSTAENQSQGSTFSSGSGSIPNSQALSVGSGITSSTQSMPIQFGSTTSSSSSGLAVNTVSTGSFIFGSTVPAKPFCSGTTGLGSSGSASNTNVINSNSTSSGDVGPAGLLGNSWQPAKSLVFSSAFSSASPSPGFSFGATTASSAATNNSPMVFGATTASAVTTNSAPMGFGASTASATTTNSAPMVFGASTASATTTNSAPMVFGASTASAATTNSAPALFGSSNGASSSIFSFSSPSVSTSTQPVFGNLSPAFSFGSSAPANNDQMNMEDSMAEDTVASVTSIPVFGQQVSPSPSPSPSPSGFVFGSAGPSASSAFQFGSQNMAAPQNSSLFAVSSSTGLRPEGSNFSMGSGGGGGDKSNRKFYKIKGKPRKK